MTLPSVSGASGATIAQDYSISNGQPGVYAPQAWGGSLTVLSLSANTALLARFRVSEPTPVASIAWMLNTAALSNDAYDIGIYTGALSRIVSLGATTGVLNGATGLKTPALSASLIPNTVYYAALSCGTIGSTAAVIRALTLGASVAVGMFGTSAPQAEALSASSSHPLPSTITGAATTANVPLFAIRTI